MDERLKKLRNELGLTQQEFADELGTNRNNIGKYEAGINKPSSSVISLICQKSWNGKIVNKKWLCEGTGEMFIEVDRENQLMIWAANILKDESDSFKRRFIKMLMDLEENDWETLEKITLSLHKKD